MEKIKKDINKIYNKQIELEKNSVIISENKQNIEKLSEN